MPPHPPDNQEASSAQALSHPCGFGLGGGGGGAGKPASPLKCGFKAQAQPLGRSCALSAGPGASQDLRFGEQCGHTLMD